MLIPDTFLTVHEETLLFLWSCLLGGALGLCFDFLRTIRLLLPHKVWMTALEDILFLFLWAASLAAFSVALAKGDLRIYYIVGNLLGFLLYRVTLGNPILRIFSRILGAIFGILGKIFRPVGAAVVQLCGKCLGKFVGNAKNQGEEKKIQSSLLIAARQMLYNKHDKMERQGEGKSGTKKKHKTQRRKAGAETTQCEEK